MDAARAGTALSVTLVLATLLATGPLVGPDAAGSGSDLGEGTASVEEVSLGAEPSLTPGRFGTGAVYLRIPDARVGLSDVEGRSRLVYRVAVPELGFDRVGTRTVAPGTTRTRVGMSDRAFAPATVNASTYRARVTVRVQSFAIDRTVFDRNVTVRAPDG